MLLLPVCGYYRSKYSSKIYIFHILAVVNIYFLHHGKQPIELDLLICFCKMTRNSSCAYYKSLLLGSFHMQIKHTHRICAKLNHDPYYRFFNQINITRHSWVNGFIFLFSIWLTYINIKIFFEF